MSEHRLDELALFIHPEYVDHNSDGDKRGPSLVAAHLEGLEHWGEADTVGMLYQMGVDPFAGGRH